MIMFTIGESTIIRKPAVYRAPDVIEGDMAIIHMVQPKQKFINLKFDENRESTKYRPKIIVDVNLSAESKKIKNEIERIEKVVVSMGEVYTCYSYLFTVKDEELYLVSLALNKTTLGFEVVQMIAKELNVKTPKPIWSGVLTHSVVSAFLEDVFIQKQL